jgi:hypothetical protein
MPEKLEIDTSILQKLVEIKNQQAQLDQYCRRADEFKDKIDKVVYGKVLQDYRKRRETLVAAAAPLKEQARREYRKLQRLYDRVKKNYEQAQFEKEELEFRRAVGELHDEELVLKLEGPEKRLEECRSELAGLDEQKAQFIDAFGSEEDIEAGAVAEPESAAEPEATPASAPAIEASAEAVEVPEVPETPTPVHARGKTKKAVAEAPVAAAPEAPAVVVMDDAALPDTTGTIGPATGEDQAAVPATPIPADIPASPDATRFVAFDATALVPVVDEAPADDGVTDRTFIMPPGMLVSEDAASPAEHRLGPFTYIGRSAENQIRLVLPGVSRRHALVTAEPDGFTIKDLQSQNGTYVNDERIDERHLEDGDRVRIGNITFVFRSSAAAAGASKAGR